MFTKFFFNRLSVTAKLAYLRKKATFIGNRKRNSSLVTLYMLSDSFVEVVYKQDKADDSPEQIRFFPNLESLNGYLEDDARVSLR